MIRLFIALEIPLEIKKNISYHINRILPDSGFRWEKSDKIHITLKFIGNFKKELLGELISSLSFIPDFYELKCSTGEFGFFIRNNKPSIFFLDLDVDNSIKYLVDRIETELTKFGIPKEKREFKVHLTLLRLKGHEDVSSLKELKVSGMPKQNFTAEDVVLYKSELLQTGSVYTGIKIYKLKRSTL